MVIFPNIPVQIFVANIVDPTAIYGNPKDKPKDNHRLHQNPSILWIHKDYIRYH